MDFTKSLGDFATKPLRNFVKSLGDFAKTPGFVVNPC